MNARVTILTFHALDDERSVISFPPALFERLVRMLHAKGPPVLSLADAVLGLRGERAVPKRSVVITFDDGYCSVYDLAFPALREHELPATVFLTVGGAEGAAGRGLFDLSARLPSIVGRQMLSWSEVREMHRAGIDFGAHTLAHPDLTRLPASDVEREMVAPKAVLEDALGESVTSFAYPFGRYDQKSRALARQHFACACSDRLGFAGQGSDLYALPRVDAYYLRREWLVDSLAKAWFPSYVRARAIPRRMRRKVGELAR